MKSCIACGVYKTNESFYAGKHMADGLLNKCKRCCKFQATKRRNEKIDEVRAYDRERAKLPHEISRRTAFTSAWRKANPEKYRAHNAINNAVRDGIVIKPGICEVDGCEETRIHGHHEDYSKPLDVKWLCPVHHSEKKVEFSETAVV